MKKTLKKIIALCLALATAFTLITAASTRAAERTFKLPKTFDRSRLDKYYRNVELTIDDMHFLGKMGVPINDADLGELVQKVLDEMGIDDADSIDRLVELIAKLDQEVAPDVKRMIDNLLTTLGVVPRVGSVATALGIIWNLYNGAYGSMILDAVQTGVGVGGSKLLEYFANIQVDIWAKNWTPLEKSAGLSSLFLGSAVENATLLTKLSEGLVTANTLVSLVRFLNMCADEWMRDQKKWQDRSDSMIAKRLLNLFYEKLEDAVRDYMNKHKDAYAIRFNSAMCFKNFPMYGTENIEGWTLDMTLFMEEGDPRYVSGIYTGDFRIKIDYDLSVLHENLKTAVWYMDGLRENYSSVEKLYSSKIFQHPTTTVNSPGTSNVTRELTGRASAVVNIGNGVHPIVMNTVLDRRVATVKGIDITLHMEYVHNEALYSGGISWSFMLSANSENFTKSDYEMRNYMDHHGGMPVAPPVLDLPPQTTFNFPWPDSIWERGSKLSAAEKKLVIENPWAPQSEKQTDKPSPTHNPSGSYEITPSEEPTPTYDANWPDNEFTRILPKPDFSFMTEKLGDQFVLTSTGVYTFDYVKAYAEKLKSAGFTIEAVTDETGIGSTIYTYTAKNKDGYKVELSYTNGYIRLVVTKPAANTQSDANWPDNEFTRVLPKPGFSFNIQENSGHLFTLMSMAATLDEAKAYVEQLRSAGFTVNANTEETSAMGMAIYTYTASNNAMYNVDLSFVSGMCSLTVTK